MTRLSWLLALLSAAALVAVAAGVQIGYAQPDPASLDWSFPEVIGADASEPTSAAAFSDVNGVLHAAWVESGATDTIFYRARSADGTWSTPRAAVETPGAEISALDMTVDAMARPHIVWLEASSGALTVMHTVKAGAVWRDAERASDEIGSTLVESPQIVGDLWSSVHVVWVDHRHGSPDVRSRRRTYGGVWNQSSVLNNVLQGDQTEPSATLTKAGTIHVAWIDTRHGTSDIYETRIPHGSVNPENAGPLVWWPNARLSQSTGGRRQSSPTMSTDGTGAVRALWIDAERNVRQAVLESGADFFQKDHTVFAGTTDIRRLEADGGPGSTVVAAWQREATDREIVAGLVPNDGSMMATGVVDLTPISSDGRSPVVAVGPSGSAHILWLGQHRFGGRDLFHSTAAVPLPEYEPYVSTGWLEYVPRRPSCPGDGFVLAQCNGDVGPFISIGNITPSFVGRYVEVRGVLVRDTACPLVRAERVSLASSPCPVAEGGVTGLVEVGGVPAIGGKVWIDDRSATVGTSGRFYLGQVAAGRHVVTATAQCALTAETEVSVQSAFTAVLPPASLVRGDVIPDCEVSLPDLVRVTYAYRRPPPYSPACTDVDGDGVVTIYDVAMVSEAYGQKCPTAWTPPPATPAPSTASPALTPFEQSSPGLAPDVRLAQMSEDSTLHLRSSEPVRALEIVWQLPPGDYGGLAAAPFDVSQSEGETLWLVNRLEGDELRLAATRVAPAPPFQPDAALAVAEAGWDFVLSRLGPATVRLAGASGRPVVGNVEVDQRAVWQVTLPGLMR